MHLVYSAVLCQKHGYHRYGRCEEAICPGRWKCIEAGMAYTEAFFDDFPYPLNPPGSFKVFKSST